MNGGGPRRPSRSGAARRGRDRGQARGCIRLPVEGARRWHGGQAPYARLLHRPGESGTQSSPACRLADQVGVREKRETKSQSSECRSWWRKTDWMLHSIHPKPTTRRRTKGAATGGYQLDCSSRQRESMSDVDAGTVRPRPTSAPLSIERVPAPQTNPWPLPGSGPGLCHLLARTPSPASTVWFFTGTSMTMVVSSVRSCWAASSCARRGGIIPSIINPMISDHPPGRTAVGRHAGEAAGSAPAVVTGELPLVGRRAGMVNDRQTTTGGALLGGRGDCWGRRRGGHVRGGGRMTSRQVVIPRRLWRNCRRLRRTRATGTAAPPRRSRGWPLALTAGSVGGDGRRGDSGGWTAGGCWVAAGGAARRDWLTMSGGGG